MSQAEELEQACKKAAERRALSARAAADREPELYEAWANAVRAQALAAADYDIALRDFAGSHSGFALLYPRRWRTRVNAARVREAAAALAEANIAVDRARLALATNTKPTWAL